MNLEAASRNAGKGRKRGKKEETNMEAATPTIRAVDKVGAVSDNLPVQNRELTGCRGSGVNIG